MNQFTYERIERTSPSGKTLYRCRVCGDETPAPCKYPYHACLDFNPWISVKDALPKEKGVYVAAAPGTLKMHKPFYSIIYLDPKYSTLLPADVSHWMPIPRLPEEGEK